MGIEPPGREWTFTHIDIHRISGGKIVEEWSAKSAYLPIIHMRGQQASGCIMQIIC